MVSIARLRRWGIVGVATVFVAGVFASSGVPASAEPTEPSGSGVPFHVAVSNYDKESTTPKPTKADPFPTILSDRYMLPSYDSSGRLTEWSYIKWDHVTVLTYSQTVLVRDSGLLPVAQQIAPKPYSELAGMARYVLPMGAERIAAGGCLTLYWQDESFKAPDGRQRQAFIQVFEKQGCYE